MSGTGMSWRATALIQHRGEATMHNNTGHYVTYTREDDDWILNNDHLRSVVPNYGVARNGYVFMTGITITALVKN